MPERTSPTGLLPSTAAGEAPGRGRMTGRRVLVIGGGQIVFDAATDPVGNGRATCLLAAREGAVVTVADRDRTAAERTAATVGEAGGTAFVVTGDVTDPVDAQRIVRDAATAMGGLDGLVYNVGIGVGGLDLHGIDIDEWDRTFDANVRGAALATRAALSLLTEGGSVVLLSSVASIRSSSRLVAYGASKAALTGLLRYLTSEAASIGIRVNIVMPGLVDTPNGRMAGAGRPSRSATTIPLGRMATGWEIAYAGLFFLSTESSYVTGQVLAVDGGRTGV